MRLFISILLTILEAASIKMFSKILAFVLLASCHAQWNHEQEHGGAVSFASQSLDYNEHKAQGQHFGVEDGFKNDNKHSNSHNDYADASAAYSKASALTSYAKSHNQEPSYINQEYQTYNGGYDVSSEHSGNYQKQQHGDNGDASFNRFTIHKTGADGDAKSHNQESSNINQQYQTYHNGYGISSEHSSNYQKQQHGDNGISSFNRFTIHKTGGDSNTKFHNQEPSYSNQEYQTYNSGYDISSEDSGNYQKQQHGDNGDANFNRFIIHETSGDVKVDKNIVVDKFKQNTQATKSEHGGLAESYQNQDTPVHYNNHQNEYHY